MMHSFQNGMVLLGEFSYPSLKSANAPPKRQRIPLLPAASFNLPCFSRLIVLSVLEVDARQITLMTGFPRNGKLEILPFFLFFLFSPRALSTPFGGPRVCGYNWIIAGWEWCPLRCLQSHGFAEPDCDSFQSTPPILLIMPTTRLH